MKFTIFTVLAAVAALPTGAPICAVEAANGKLGASQALGFSASTKANADGSISVIISNSQNRPSFQGILMYVTSGSANQHLGSFILPNNRFRALGADVCGDIGKAGSTITHSSSAGISTSTTLTWIPSATDVKLSNVVVKTVIVQSVTGGHNYQLLADAPVNFLLPKAPAPKANPASQVSSRVATKTKPSNGTHTTKTLARTTTKAVTTKTLPTTTIPIAIPTQAPYPTAIPNAQSGSSAMERSLLALLLGYLLL
ncbi:hypothetical protein HDV01_000392 [Terramyces sp. JEL0728]|nr:hypothetical protein HDV01_000392 [Terramyces sp. JEL0728]